MPFLSSVITISCYLRYATGRNEGTAKLISNLWIKNLRTFCEKKWVVETCSSIMYATFNLGVKVHKWFIKNSHTRLCIPTTRLRGQTQTTVMDINEHLLIAKSGQDRKLWQKLNPCNQLHIIISMFHLAGARVAWCGIIRVYGNLKTKVM